MKNKENQLRDLIGIIDRLRGPGGCPWDQRQTKEDLKAYVIDEAYEVIDAIDQGAYEALKEELGDLLFQILFLAKIAEEEGGFTIDAVIKSISDKMIRRHPHVFSDQRVKGIEEIRTNWKKIKESEGKPSRDSILPELSSAIPALYRAQKLVDIASKKGGLDWTGIEDIIEKIDKKWSALKGILQYDQNRSRLEDEFGDLLFLMASLGRHINVDTEKALKGATEKFVRRFRFIEFTLKKEGRNIREASPDEMALLWRKAKQSDKIPDITKKIDHITS